MLMLDTVPFPELKLGDPYLLVRHGTTQQSSHRSAISTGWRIRRNPSHSTRRRACKGEGTNMNRVLFGLISFTVCLALGGIPLAAEKGKAKSAAKSLATMTEEDLIKLALSAAPERISKDASVMVPAEDGKLKKVRKGTNGFTCIPTVNYREVPDPMCMDAAVSQWATDLMNGAPKPSNSVPGISYMARGGMHWEKDGKILMKEEPGATLVKEPPHWMMMWPFDSGTAKLPNHPNPSGVWIMFDGTPYAHLMVYQDPNKMK
jgi:hypothetical protein